MFCPEVESGCCISPERSRDGSWFWIGRGAIGILFALITPFLSRPEPTILILMFGALVLVDGLLTILGTVESHRARPCYRFQRLEGASGTLIGVMSLLWPAANPAVLLQLLSTWALVVGVLRLMAAQRMRPARVARLLRATGGLLAILLATAFVLEPDHLLLPLPWLLGSYAFLFGSVALGFGLWVRSSPA